MDEKKKKALDSIAATKNWINKIVVGLGLCPFASKVIQDKQVAFYSCPFTSIIDTLTQLLTQVKEIKDQENNISTSLLVITEGLEDFETYMDAFHTIEATLEVENAEVIQMASFHPEYRFKDVEADDITNYTNRSPYPIFHLLRVKDVSEAIDSHPDIHGVAPRNKDVLRKLGLEAILDLYN